MAARIRTGGFRLSSTTARIRTGGFRLSGSLPTSPRIRQGGFRLSGPALSTITPTDVTAFPNEEVTLTFQLGLGGTLPDSLSWAVSGAGGTITPSGLYTAVFKAPSSMPPQADSIITATPRVGGVDGIPIVAYVHTYPQTIYIRNPGQTSFSGVRRQEDRAG